MSSTEMCFARQPRTFQGRRGAAAFDSPLLKAHTAFPREACCRSALFFFLRETASTYQAVCLGTPVWLPRL